MSRAMETVQVGEKDVILTHELKRDLVMELKKRNFNSTPSEHLWAIDAGRKPKEILTSSRKGDAWKRNSLGKPEGGWPSFLKSPFLNGEGEKKNKNDILNGNLIINRRGESVSSSSTISPPDSPGELSSSNRRSFTLISSSRPGSGSRSSRMSPRLSSSTSSLNRTKMPETSAPPLIPPPKGFLQRQASLSSSTSSLSSEKRFSLPQQPSQAELPSPPPPLESSFHSDTSSMSQTLPPPPPQYEDTPAAADASFSSTSSSSTEVPSPAMSRSSKSSSSTSHTPHAPAFSTPPPSPPPPPPPPGLDISFSSSSTIPPPSADSPAASDLESSSHLHVPHVDSRKNSMSPSEVLGIFDLALEGQGLSVSTYTDTPSDFTTETFSPTFKFSSISDDLLNSNYEDQPLVDPFSPGVNSVADKEDAPNESNHQIIKDVSTHVSQLDPVSTSQNTDKETSLLTEAVAESQILRRYSSSEQHIPVEISELSPISREARKKRPQSFMVTKLRPDVKTVRQQIKPGTVEDLASLFTNMKHHYMTSPTKEKEEINFDIKEKIKEIKSYEQPSESGSQPTSPRDLITTNEASPRKQSWQRSSSSSSNSEDETKTLDKRISDSSRSSSEHSLHLEKNYVERKLSVSSRSSSEHSLHLEKKEEHLERKLSVRSRSSSEHSLHLEKQEEHLERKLSVSSRCSSEHSLHLEKKEEHLERKLSVSSRSSSEHSLHLEKKEEHLERKLSVSSRSSSEHSLHLEKKEEHLEKKLSVSSRSSSEHSLHLEKKEEHLERKLSVSSRSSSEHSLHLEKKEEHLERKLSVSSRSSSEHSLHLEKKEEHLERKLSVSSRSSSEHSLHLEKKEEHQERKLSVSSRSSSEHSLHLEKKEEHVERKLSVSSRSSSEHSLQEHLELAKKLSSGSRSSSDQKLHVGHAQEPERKLFSSSRSSSESSLHQKHTDGHWEQQRKLFISSSSTSEQSLHLAHKQEHLEQERKLSVSSRSSSEPNMHQEQQLHKALSTSSSSSSEESLKGISKSDDSVYTSIMYAFSEQGIKSPLQATKTHDSMPHLNSDHSFQETATGLHAYKSDSNILSSSTGHGSKLSGGFDFLSASREIMKQITSRGSSRNSSFRKTNATEDIKPETDLDMRIKERMDLSPKVLNEGIATRTTSEIESGDTHGQSHSLDLHVNIDPRQDSHTSLIPPPNPHAVDTHDTGKDVSEVILDLPVNHLASKAIFGEQHAGGEVGRHLEWDTHLHKKENEQKEDHAYEMKKGADIERNWDQSASEFIQAKPSVSDSVTARSNIVLNNTQHIDLSIRELRDNTLYENENEHKPTHLDVEREETSGFALKPEIALSDLFSQLKGRNSPSSRSRSSSSSSSSKSSKSETHVDDSNDPVGIQLDMIDKQGGSIPSHESLLDSPHSGKEEDTMSSERKAVHAAETTPDDAIAHFSSVLDFHEDSSSSSSDESEEGKEGQHDTPLERNTPHAVEGPSTHVSNVTPSHEDGLHEQTGETGLFAHRVVSVDEPRGRGDERAGEVTETEVARNLRQEVALSSASKPEPWYFSSTSYVFETNKEHPDENKLIDNQSNDFLSILDDIQIDKDLSFNSHNQETNSAVFSKENQIKSDSKSDSKDSSDSVTKDSSDSDSKDSSDSESKDSSDSDDSDINQKPISQKYVVNEHTVNDHVIADSQPQQISLKKVISNFEVRSVASSDSEPKLSHTTDREPFNLRQRKSDLDEAIRQQHFRISAHVGDHDRSSRDNSDEARSVRGSVSSLKSDAPAKETVFNSSFFKEIPLATKKLDHSKPSTPTSVIDSGPVLWSSHEQVTSFLSQTEKKKSKSSSSSSSSSSKNHPLIKNVKEEAKRISSSSSSTPSSPKKQGPTQGKEREILSDLTSQNNVSSADDKDHVTPARASIFRHRSLTRSRSSSRSSDKDRTSKAIDESELLTKDRFKALRQSFERKAQQDQNSEISTSFRVNNNTSNSKEHKPIIRGNSWSKTEAIREPGNKLTGQVSNEPRPQQKLLPDLFKGYTGGKTSFPNYFSGDVENSLTDPYHLNAKPDKHKQDYNKSEESDSDSDTSASSKDDSKDNIKRKLSGQRNKQIRYSYDLQTGEARRESLSKKVSNKSNTSNSQFEDVFLQPRDDDSSSSSESDTKLSVKNARNQAQKHSYKESSSSSSSDDENPMTAIVGEVSSFGIRKRVTTHEETTLSQPQDDHLTDGHSEPNSADIYLIQDGKGDYYALQEVEENEGKSEETNVKAHIISTNGMTNGYSLDTHESNLTVDSSDVDDDKAREVIDAFLDSQAFFSKRQDKSLHTSSALNQDISQAATYHNGGDAGWGRHASERDTERRTTTWHEAPSEEVLSRPGPSTVVHQSGFDEGRHNSSRMSGDYTATSIHAHDDVGSPSQLYQLNSAYSSPHNTLQQISHLSDQSIPSGYVLLSPTSASLQQPSLMVNFNQGHYGVSPYATTPITVTTTTQAVVGEKVDMKIDFSPPLRTSEERPMAPPETISSPHSEHDITGTNYVIRTVPNKSSLKKTSQFDNDVLYTKSDTLTADVRLGGQNREILLKPYEEAPLTYSTNETYAPTLLGGTMYQVKTRPSSHSPSHDNYVTSDSHARPLRDSYYKSDPMEASDLYRVRNLSTSVPDTLHHVTENTRGRQANRAPGFNDTDSSYRIIGGSGQKHHSPDRFFKNAKLSLRKDEYAAPRTHSFDDDTLDEKKYRTVTKVYVNGDNTRSRSPSPQHTQYKVSTLQSQESFNKKVASNTNTQQSLYVVNTKASKTHKGSESDSDSDSQFKKSQKRYRVLGTSDSALNFIGNKTFSTPSHTGYHNRSFDEANIVTTKTILPSRLQSVPPVTNTHRTIIQLEVDRDKKIRETQKVEADFVDSRYVVKQPKSDDDPHSKTLYKVTNTSGPAEYALWRTGRARSMDSLNNLPGDASRLRTFEQTDGNRLYVVNSSVSDPRGWYKSTIDINENHPEQKNHNTSLEGAYHPRPDNYVTEKTVYYVKEKTPSSRSPYRSYSTEFVSPDSGQGTEVASSDGENESRHKFERVERIYEVKSEPEVPDHLKSTESLSNDLRVLRGKILIQNRLDGSEHTDDDFDENANLFDTSFHLGKDNPLYSSDPDLRASLEREEQAEISRQLNHDITFETVDKIAHKFKGASGQVELSPKPKRKQNISALLLSKLANIDSKDIRQTIDVEHHNEEIFGDIDFIHADGQRSGSRNTANFDSVNEKVELTLTQGKAFVIIKVIAERIVPTDYEFNVWRKSQAIVTRQIEIDLLANEQRRRLYQHVMDRAGHSGYLEEGGSRPGASAGTFSTQERQLSSMETLKLFSQILDVADGQGDREHTDLKTKQEMGQLPESDLLY
ncbi:serine-rich adhesin for platelets-like [Biomphalaria glabrata]|uniref:Serine-rich adhesin for platelets-like n=1 Tax=Biomphalaria glabrata TaxID=6526 RepID=A0A9W3B4P3_BIOGL|nr:serine-rich adhesin for platelets-like [Biomphalaria glabrata]XP_055894443.1 serine-rich adhesin for platelets-like [Biomphalaria glabrata]